MFSIKTKQTNPNYTYNLKTTLKKLSGKKVVVGFPKGKLNAPHYEYEHGRGMSRSKKKPSIIDVAIWNNFGIGVPRRDFMTPAAKKWQDFIQETFSAIQKAIEKGQIDEKKFFEMIGLKGADIVSQEIIDLSTPPNSPETIRLKGSSNPLVDTGDLAKSPIYEIREVDK